MTAIVIPTYMDAMAESFPGIPCSASGIGDVYEQLRADGGATLPSKAQLDAVVLQLAKSRAKATINNYRDMVAFDKFLYDNIEWDCDQNARDNISDLYDSISISGGQLPAALITWRDYNNVDRPIPNAFYAVETLRRCFSSRSIR